MDEARLAEIRELEEKNAQLSQLVMDAFCNGCDAFFADPSDYPLDHYSDHSHKCALPQDRDNCQTWLESETKGKLAKLV